MATYQRKMQELGLGDGNGVNVMERIGSSAPAMPPSTNRVIPADDPRNRASPGM